MSHATVLEFKVPARRRRAARRVVAVSSGRPYVPVMQHPCAAAAVEPEWHDHDGQPHAVRLSDGATVLLFRRSRPTGRPALVTVDDGGLTPSA
jgi:hypothetical protein